MATSLSSSRFITASVTTKVSIKKFVQDNGLSFTKGSGYYQLTKPEVIQDYKKVVARRKVDGSFVSGDTVKKVLGIKSSAKKFSLKLSEVPDFDVFVQSTSVNRVLLPGTEFLYEAEEVDEVKTPATKKRKSADTASGATPSKKAKKETVEDVDAGKEAEVKMSAAGAGAGGPMEIVFSFDTTGSMYPCLTQVRREVAKTVKRLQEEIPGIRMAVIAHGDYCDANYGGYITEMVDFTTDIKKLCTFVEEVKPGGGGDWEECYELVLYEARTKLSWTPGTQRSLVMIGDAIPHNTSYSLNTLKLDWKKEAAKLKSELGVKIYSVQALNNSVSTSFYRQLADLTDGYHLHLDQFSTIVQFIMAICFREQSVEMLQVYEDEVKTKGGTMNRSLHKLFDTLANRKESSYSGGSASCGLTPVNPARFQVLAVDEKCDIRSYVGSNGLIFKTGRGFYEFTKPEKISDKKEVVLVDKITGDMFTGPEACSMIGAGGSSRIKPTSLDKWRIFVQSTSYNRVLIPGTGFLYEVDSEH